MTAPPATSTAASPAPRRTTLTLAGVAVAFTAADTYVVVLVLPEMMSGVGLNLDELQRAAPIVSGFLLGYVAMLPLIGRVSDISGRVPVLVFSLLVFAFGSMATAASHDLPAMVLGRFLQGLGGGGLVPVTLALVADLWPARHRGIPLGVVGAVQELGSVLGPLYGALVLALWPWPAIFWINLLVGVLLAVAMGLLSRRIGAGADRRTHDWTGGALLACSLLACTLLLLAPRPLTTHVTLGLAWVPVVGGYGWSTPLALLALSGSFAFVARELTARAPLVDLRAFGTVARQTDMLGAALLALALAGVVLAFATADPEVAVFAPQGPWLLAGSAVAAAAFWWRQRTAALPLVPRRALSDPAAWGSLVVSFFVGSALVAALVDVPIFARVTTEPHSQLGAALVLLRFLVALPVGALLGGWLVRRWAPGFITCCGMSTSAVGFLVMTQWGQTSLDSAGATVTLAACGLGFGLAIAPVNAALLAATESPVHGVSSALVVVSRMVGMLVGVSALTTIGLARFYAVEESIPPPTRLCPDDPTSCPAYTELLRDAGLVQLHTVFAGAAVCAVVAALVALWMLRGPARRRT